MLIECKHVGEKLPGKDQKHVHQLYSYFNAVNAQFGILTNGIIYQFYKEDEASHKKEMELSPFFRIDLRHLSDGDIRELAKFTKESFSPEETLDRAKELQDIAELKRRLLEEMIENPSDEFVKMIAKGMLQSGKSFTKERMNRFAKLITNAFEELVDERIIELQQKELQIKQTEDQVDQTLDIVQPQVMEEQLPTIDEATAIIMKFLEDIIDLDRVSVKTAKTYHGIILDSKSHKTICRLYFNCKTKRYIDFKIPSKTSYDRYELSTAEDLFKHRESLVSIAKSHDKR